MAINRIFFYQTALGKISIAENGKAITNIYFQTDNIPEDFILQETDLIKEANTQLGSYLSGTLKDFALPLAPSGTEFMHRVWEVLHTIPYGETRSYKQVAQSIGNIKSSRAVGLANNKNPIPIIIPCHRVIGTNRKLVGYRGGLQIKEHLLKMERPNATL